MVAESMAAQAQKPRWGEMEDEEAEDLDFLLPPKQVVGPDENGIKKIIEYKFNDEGHKVKTTTTIRVRKLAEARLSKRAIERRSWGKFGDAATQDAAGDNRTNVSTEEILLERPRPPGSKQEETKASGDPFQVSKAGGVLMVCRTCLRKGDHWTAQCPYKDLAQPNFMNKPPTPDADKPGLGKNTYVSPALRDKGPGERTPTEMRRRNDENSVRVSNLSEDTREADLGELFRPFGTVSRTYVAFDQKTGMSRGFGFVNFVSREDAERAINKLNGYGYDNLILRVEWAAPRAT
ncbi:hypothetical protein Leryth_005264 [Lithospermum erythrorhizon]|uniref:Eukaryotic translation initiation factor 3 subunit G n=1 Tax=Lithospermum erythrorhizon TaxID=34254 RepID=A0AAV3RX21_LITER|nr:hypothetical protein Leryth_005264 [Lithospermum erythrorhizon]